MMFPGRRRGKGTLGKSKGIGLGVFGGALLLLGAGVWWGHRELRELPSFEVSEILVQGNHHLSTQEILDRLPLPVPVNILQLNLERLARRIATHPWIRSASIRWRLPLSIIVTIEERQPAALLVAAKTYLVSTDAVILEEVQGTPLPDLSKFRTPWRAEYSPGEAITDPRLLKGFHLLRELERAEPLRQERVEEITVEADGNYILQLERGRTLLRIGSVEPLVQMRRLDSTLRHRGQGLNSFAYVDLRFPGSVILKPLEKGG
jgi:cell division protein FtsQ